MRFVFFFLAVTGAAILWPFYAHSLSLMLDRVHIVFIESPALDHFRYDNGVLAVDQKNLYLMTPEFVGHAR